MDWLRWDVVSWGALALLLMAAETLAPGAFMLWMGFAAAAVFEPHPDVHPGALGHVHPNGVRCSLLHHRAGR